MQKISNQFPQPRFDSMKFWTDKWSQDFTYCTQPFFRDLHFYMMQYIHVKLEKFKRGRSPSLHLAKEGDFARNPFCDINFVHQHSNSGWYFENDETFPPNNGLQLFIWCITCYYCTLWILCWLSNAFSLQNSIQFTISKEKMIGRKWGSKRGRFSFLGGRWMFRREMGSKRGSLPPKEGDLTCMAICHIFITSYSVQTCNRAFVQAITANINHILPHHLKRQNYSETYMLTCDM